MSGQSLHRLIIVVAVIAAGGCAGVRHGLGAYQKAADKGIGIGSSGNPGSGTAPPNSVVENGTTATEQPSGRKAPRPAVLPGGLGGDSAHRAYTTGTPN